MPGGGEERIKTFLKTRENHEAALTGWSKTGYLLPPKFCPTKLNTCLNPFLSFLQSLTLISFVHHNISNATWKKNLRNTSHIFSFFFLENSCYFFGQILFLHSSRGTCWNIFKSQLFVFHSFILILSFSFSFSHLSIQKNENETLFKFLEPA